MKSFGSRVGALSLCIGAVFLSHFSQAQTTGLADYIVALVNSEPITDSELRAAMRRVTEQLKSQGQPVPPTDALRQGVLERLISDRAQLQLAREYGVRVEQAAIDNAEENLARQNQMSVPELRKKLASDGLSVNSVRDELRDQLTLARLREHEVDSRVQISDQEVDRYLAQEQAANKDPMAQEINLAQLLIAVPEHADAAQVDRLQDKAKQLLQRMRGGEKFADLVAQYSDADRSKGGQLGLRKADRYPSLFVQATSRLPVGGVSDIVRSGAGFHILSVLERRAPPAPVRTVAQTHARHILLRLGPDMTQEQALARLADFRERILKGKDSFESLAKQYSQDGSAQRGGDLGWASPGMFVPEFEDVMSHLREGEISLPMVSRFGTHLIQVLGHRTEELSQRDVRELVRRQLHDAKVEENYANWAKDVRARAYVEMRDTPV